ncbi:MAG: phospholipase D family protein [Pseudomonadota bacterium]|nr:phospholipase D family protein [Pseudomonadota bacterium]
MTLRRVIRWTLALLALVVVLSAAALWSWGEFASRAQGEPAHALPTAADATALDRALVPLLARHEDRSAAALIADNVQAFTLRAQAAREAGRSLDVQYYIWRDDLTGNLLKNELIAAAQRGVRVRLLLDDINAGGRDELLLLMDAHPHLEVRLYNPARNRGGAWRRALEMGLRFVSFNRRMHNKAWIADNRAALVGGRNVGDEYFDAAEQMNFHDADLLLLGPVVAEASAIFDSFWNSAEVIPLRALHRQPPAWSDAALGAWQAGWQAEAAASPWLRALGDPDRFSEKVSDTLRLHWTDSLRVLSDPPQKAAPLASQRAPEQWLIYDLLKLLFSAETETWLISPYFVPGGPGALALAGQAVRGVDVHVLTNSLAANDVPLVHAGYMHYRAPLLASGVKLHELKAGGKGTAQARDRELLGSSGASLHTKAVVVDAQRGFVGSFNFDPRSAQLNTEMGVWFDHGPLAEEVRALAARGARPSASYALSLAEGGALRWQAESSEDGQPREWSAEPDTSLTLRLLVRALSWLPIESQL